MRNFLVFLVVISVLSALVIRVRYGGGEPYEDISTPALLEQTSLERVLSYAEPIGNVAISDGGRIFFTVHPEARPQGNKLLEWLDGAAVPYPSGSVQPHLFDSVLGLTIDDQQRLWTLDHGGQGFGKPRLLAFDLKSGELAHDHAFADDIAPAGSFLHDLRLTPDGRFVVIADGSVLRKKPALIVYDTERRAARRILQDHESVAAGKYVLRHSSGDLSFLGGLFTIKSGVASIAIDGAGNWLYYGSLNQGQLYRLPLASVIDPLLPATQLQQQIEFYSSKPLSDGIAAGPNGNIYISDVEHNAISVIGEDRQPRTLIRAPRLRWPASLSLGPGGQLFVADSAFPELLLHTREHIHAQGPFSIYRVNTAKRMTDL